MQELASLARKYTALAFFIIALIVSAFLYYWLNTRTDISEYFIGIIASTALASLFTGACLSLAEKFGWLSNYKQEMAELSEKISELPASLEAKLAFGLDEMHDNFDEAGFLRNHKGGEICWLNTYFDRWTDKPEIFKRAIKNGSKVRMLFMDPESAAKHQRAYYSCDNGAPEAVDKSLNLYDWRLRNNAIECESRVESVMRELNETEENLIEVRFYNDAAQLPLIIGCEEENTEISEASMVSRLRRIYRPQIGASGFYLDKFSKNLPYITWKRRGVRSENEIVERMYEYFNKKWNAPDTRDLEQVLKQIDREKLKDKPPV